MSVLADILAPVRCVACGTPADGDLCLGCALGVDVLAGPCCPRCGAPGAATSGVRPADVRCPACVGLEGFDRARSLLWYGGVARPLVLALKRNGRPGLARAAGGLLAELVVASGIHPDSVAFVPAGRRARSRGFDHAELLARAIAGHLDIPLSRALVRTGDGPRQADVPLARRRDNARGRFAAHPVRGSVLLVDDVFTTGATAEACALALRESGASEVDVCTLARTARRTPRSVR